MQFRKEPVNSRKFIGAALNLRKQFRKADHL